MASFMWFVWFAFTCAVAVRTVVSPSISVSIGAAVGKWTSLSLKNWEFMAIFTLLMETGVGGVTPGSKAMFTLFTKNANTSLNEPTNSLYSSDANT